MIQVIGAYKNTSCNTTTKIIDEKMKSLMMSDNVYERTPAPWVENSQNVNAKNT